MLDQNLSMVGSKRKYDDAQIALEAIINRLSFGLNAKVFGRTGHASSIPKTLTRFDLVPSPTDVLLIGSTLVQLTCSA